MFRLASSDSWNNLRFFVGVTVLVLAMPENLWTLTTLRFILGDLLSLLPLLSSFRIISWSRSSERIDGECCYFFLAGFSNFVDKLLFIKKPSGMFLSLLWIWAVAISSTECLKSSF